MSGPILITVGNVLWKTHNRLPLWRRRLGATHEANGLHHQLKRSILVPQRSRPRAGTNLILELRLLPHLKDSPNWTVLSGPHKGENDALKSKQGPLQYR